jgi:Protein of unknown function (DUF4239)
MSALETTLIVFGATFAAGLLGMALHMIVPERHLDSESRDVVKLVMGLIATMAALVLSLLIASGNSSYQTQQTEVQSLSANIILLDRVLSFYGPDANEPRELLRRGVAAIRDRIWSADGARNADFDPGETKDVANAFIESIEKLSPKTDSQTALKAQALQISQNLGRTRLLMFEQSASSLSWPFLTVLVFWIVTLFLGFGLFARFNAMVTMALLIGAVSVAGSIFLILELNEPYKGLMRISDTPVRNALVVMDR